MKAEAAADPGRRRLLALGLGLFLFSIYLFVYRGGFHSVDEVSMFAVTESLVKFGRFDTDQVAWTQWTTTQAEAQGFFGPDGHVYSKKGLALSLAQAPLYWAALHLPGLGMLQTVSLLNAGVTAATGLLILMFAWRLGFAPVTALVVSLLFGLATIAFVYAKYLFSEPLAGFLLLLAAYMLFTYRQEGGLRHVAIAGLAAGLAVLTRANNLFLIPVFGLYLLWIAAAQQPANHPPTPPSPFVVRNLQSVLSPLLLFGLALALVGAAMLAYNAVRSGHPLQTGYDLTLFSPNILLGLYKLLFSPLRGLFIYTPLLLFSLPGWWRLRRLWPAEAWLFAGLVLVTLGLFSAWSSGEGLSWGSRFLVPLVPLLTLCLAPLFQQPPPSPLSNSPFTIHHSSFTIPLLLLSFLIQLLGVSINPWVYLARLQAEFGGEFFLEKTAALYDFRYSQIVGQVQSWSEQNSDLAWWQPWGFDWPAFGLSLALVLLCGWLLVQAARPAGDRIRRLPLLLLVAGLAALGLSYGLLARYYRTDRQFGPPDDGYTQALTTAAAGAAPEDRIVAVAPYHYHVPMNRFKARLPLLGFARQEWPPPDSALPLLAEALRGQNGWLVTVGFQPAAPDNAAERWLTFNAFKATDTWFPEQARLARYGVDRASISRPVADTLGQTFRLVEVKTVEQARPGRVLPVELVWLPLAPVETDYHLFLQLLAADGRLAAQHDGPPNGGYSPTRTWAVEQPVRTRHGLALAPDLPAGTYRLVAGMVDPATGARLPVAGSGDSVDLGRINLSEQR